MKSSGILAVYVILIVIVQATLAQLRQKRVDHSGSSSDFLRSPFHPPDEHGNTLNYEEKHFQAPVKSLGPQKSPFVPPSGNDNNYKHAIPTATRTRVKSAPNPPKSTQKVFNPPQNVKRNPVRIQVKAERARDDTHTNPFKPPSGVDQARKTSVPEIAPKTEGRVKGNKKQSPSSRLDSIIARNRDNSREIPSISEIRVKSRTIPEPSVPKTIARRRGGNRVRPRLSAFQNSRRPKHRDIHDVGPGVTPWTRYTARPRNTPRRQDSNSSSFQGRCGNVKYSPREQICCQGSISRRQGTQPSCCGRSTYDASYKKCCRGKVFLRTAQISGC